MPAEPESSYGHSTIPRPVHREYWLEKTDRDEWKPWMDEHVVRRECVDCGMDLTGDAQAVDIIFMDEPCEGGEK